MNNPQSPESAACARVNCGHPKNYHGRPKTVWEKSQSKTLCVCCLTGEFVQPAPISSAGEPDLSANMASAAKNWKGVDVDEFMAEMRGYEADGAEIALIESEYEEILYHDYPIIFIGRNKAGQRIVGSFIQDGKECDEYFHSITDDGLFKQLESAKISYRQFLRLVEQIYIVKYDDNQKATVVPIKYEDIPDDIMPGAGAKYPQPAAPSQEGVTVSGIVSRVGEPYPLLYIVGDKDVPLAEFEGKEITLTIKTNEEQENDE